MQRTDEEMQEDALGAACTAKTKIKRIHVHMYSISFFIYRAPGATDWTRTDYVVELESYTSPSRTESKGGPVVVPMPPSLSN